MRDQQSPANQATYKGQTNAITFTSRSLATLSPIFSKSCRIKTHQFADGNHGS